MTDPSARGAVSRSAPRTRRIDLHIGVEKTGTTTFQRTMHAARRELLSAGVLYPTSLGTPNHTALGLIGRDDDVVDDLRRWHGLTTPADLARYRAERHEAFAREVAQAGVDRILLSNEHCSSRLVTTREVARVVDWVEEAADGVVHVHVYLRRQDRMLESHHSTAVRGGTVTELTLPSDAQMRSLYDFEALLDRWAEVVGPDRLHPRRFVRSELRGGGIVTDMQETLGLTTLELPVVPPRNTALDRATQQFSIRMNQHLPRTVGDDHNVLHGLFVRALDDVEPIGDPERLTPQQARELLDRVGPGNDAVASRWFGEESLFAEDVGERQPSPALDVDRAVELAAHVLEHVAASLRARHRRQTASLEARVEALEATVAEAERRAATARAKADRVWTMPSHRLGRLLAHPLRTIRGLLGRLQSRRRRARQD